MLQRQLQGAGAPETWTCPVCGCELQDRRSYKAHISRFHDITEMDNNGKSIKTPSGRDPKCCISSKNAQHMALISRCKTGPLKVMALEFAKLLYDHSVALTSSDDRYTHVNTLPR
jgi:hypothetical protein